MKETWQDRLKRFEAMPPPQLWDRVEASLEQDPASVAERLQAFTAPPPAGMWDRIEQQLDGTATAEEAPVVAFPRRRNSFFAYAAAAALIGAILVGTTLLLNRNEPAPAVAVRTGQPATAPAATTAPLHTAAAPEEAATTQTDIDVAITAPANNPAATRADQTASRVPARSAAPGPAVRVPANTYASASLARTAPAHTAALDEDRYLVRSYNNGSTVRFSKKVSPVVDCAEHSTGFSQSLCKVSIGAVQEKMALSVVTDFGGLIERLQDLETSK
ncbi:hypothetical protein [Flaviaesturariibacter aridisoli]|uniref:Uncharacterized protein n=1 Tax=Flaviaesturariibacter aridisoli TaxID=2545761 RepID=A0A4R4E8U4_9BACT|nr:hypothetical protein [Flaviaesturariibacter aridisoli]TCZ74521.1 hypothetical protein E0486_02530 [Flaviaesturariibacter aridisoli]